MNFSKIGKDTKKVYLSQHSNYLRDPDLFNRFYKASVDPKFHGLDEGWLKGKSVLDIGCGNSAYMEKALADLGAKSITCLDIGTEWIELLDQGLKSVDVDTSIFNYISGSCVDLPFEDNSFDYVDAFGKF